MAVVVCCGPFRLGSVCYGGLGGVCHGEVSHGMAVLVGFVQVRHGQSWSDGYGAFRLGRVRFDWLRSGKAV